ncbi:MAG: response regulator transcription factor, partial [Campylobacterota bacterium]|nr:response regulator transcription factor [Campylobacterota bacterium]
MQVDEKDLLQILKQLKILLVDDNPVYQDSIKNVLLNFSDNITISDNGIDAFEQYKSCKPDIIVTDDIEMPKMNGLELVKKIREDDDRTSIIILTSFLSEDYLLSAANLDIQGYMQKALDIKKLKALLLKAAKKHANEQIVKIDIKDGLVYDKSAGTLITNNDVANELNKKEKAL